MSFFLLRLLCIVINLPYTHVWNTVVTSGLVPIVGTHTWNCRTVGSSLPASLEPLAHRRNVASLSLFYRCYFGICSSEVAQLVPFSFSRRGSVHYSGRLPDFSVIIPICYKDAYVNSFLPRTVRLLNSLPIECFPLTYDLSGFNFRMNGHLLAVGGF